MDGSHNWYSIQHTKKPLLDYCGSNTYALDASLALEADGGQIGLPAGLAVGLAIDLDESDVLQFAAAFGSGADEAGGTPALSQRCDERPAEEVVEGTSA